MKPLGMVPVTYGFSALVDAVALRSHPGAELVPGFGVTGNFNALKLICGLPTLKLSRFQKVW